MFGAFVTQQYSVYIECRANPTVAACYDNDHNCHHWTEHCGSYTICLEHFCTFPFSSLHCGGFLIRQNLGQNKAIMSEQLLLKGTLKGHDRWVTQIATNPLNPDTILSSSRDKTIICWKLTRDNTHYSLSEKCLR